MENYHQAKSSCRLKIDFVKRNLYSDCKKMQNMKFSAFGMENKCNAIEP